MKGASCEATGQCHLQTPREVALCHKGSGHEMKEVLHEGQTGAGDITVHLIKMCLHRAWEAAESVRWLLRQRSGCVLDSTSMQEQHVGKGSQAHAPCSACTALPTCTQQRHARASQGRRCSLRHPRHGAAPATTSGRMNEVVAWPGCRSTPFTHAMMLHDFCPFAAAHASHLTPHTAMRCLSTGGDGDVARRRLSVQQRPEPLVQVWSAIWKAR